MPSVANFARRYIVFAVVCAACAACAPHDAYDFPNTLGVLPPQKPVPLWLGAIRGSSQSGAASVTPSRVPGWENVMISIGDSQAGAMYDWSLRSGGCGSQGSVVGPADRYGTFTVRADGSGFAEATVPATLSPSASYAVVATPVSSNAAAAGTATGACANLSLQSM